MKNLKCVLVVLCVGMLFAACKKECVHQYQSEITLQASCVQEGEETFTCVLCQHSYTQSVPVTEHSYGPAEVETEATCAEEGLQKYSCEVCGAINSETIEKLPHTLENSTVIKVPNCTEEGECTGDCAVCGAKQVTQKMTINDVHVFTNTVVREATCTDPGEGLNTCTLCQYSETCQYELKGHTYSQQKTITEATCSAAGEKQLVCSGCGKTVKEVIAATGHKWTGATCTKAGVCSKCGVTGEKTDHAYVTIEDRQASETFAGYRMKKCSTCGKEKEEYYTASYVYNLEEMGAEIAAYARQRGFQTCLEEVSDPDYKYSSSVWELERFSWGPDRVLQGGKSRIDAAYNTYAGTPAGIGAYTAHIYVYYTQSGAIGGGFIGVYIDITS